MIIGDIELLCQKAQIRYLIHTESALFLLFKYVVQQGNSADFLSCHDVGIDLCVFDGNMSHKRVTCIEVNVRIQREYDKGMP